MESCYAVVKFAAGSVFTGQFVKLQGLGAELAWGLPFTGRPVSLKGYAAYTSTPVTDADPAYASLLGQPDTGHILIALTDWPEQFHVVVCEDQCFEVDQMILDQPLDAVDRAENCVDLRFFQRFSEHADERCIDRTGRTA